MSVLMAPRGAAGDPLPNRGATAESPDIAPLWLTTAEGPHALPAPFLERQCGFWRWPALPHGSPPAQAINN